MSKPKAKPAAIPQAPKAPSIPQFIPTALRNSEAVAGNIVESIAKHRPKKLSERERLACALLQQWLSYRSDMGEASADHFYALRYYTALFLGADHKRVVSRRPDCSRVAV